MFYVDGVDWRLSLSKRRRVVAVAFLGVSILIAVLLGANVSHFVFSFTLWT